MAKILLESGGIMWKNAIYLFSSILIASLVILISGRYLDGISGSYLGEQKQRLEVQTEYQTELEKVQAGNVYEKLVNKKRNQCFDYWRRYCSRRFGNRGRKEMV
ncbi:MAG TPA: hypothetical protein PLP24_08625 [Acetivibrio thermocellus]|nr:hypothetical protein [Acetivibrio thermocellus]